MAQTFQQNDIGNYTWALCWDKFSAQFMDIANFPDTYVSSNDQQPQLFLGLAMVVATVEAIVQARPVGGTFSGETLLVMHTWSTTPRI